MAKMAKAGKQATVQHNSSGRRLHSSIGLKTETKSTMIELLNRRLADSFDLYSQLKQAHWSVRGMHFIALHELFDSLAAEFLGYGDELAERIAALGGYAFGTVRQAGLHSSLPEYPVSALSGEDHVVALVERVAMFANLTRDSIEAAEEDTVTADLLTEIARAADKHLWFLEAHMPKGKA